KSKKSVKLMMEKLFGIELELMLSTIKAKTINGEVQLHALVDGKKIIVTESTVTRRSFLMLFGVTAALIDVNVAQSKLVLLENFNENYSKCLRLLLKDLKSKGFDAIQEMFDKAFKKQKVDDDKETTKLKHGLKYIKMKEEYQLMQFLCFKVSSIAVTVRSTRRKEKLLSNNKSNGKSQMYMVFSHMLKGFDKEYLKDLYKLVKARYGSIRLVESMDYLLWNDMKIMFEPHVKDESMQIYMLVEKKYPLTPPTLSMMLDKKLQIDYESKMAYQLCKLFMKQLKNTQLVLLVNISTAGTKFNAASVKLVLLVVMTEVLAQLSPTSQGGGTGGQAGRGGGRTGGRSSDQGNGRIDGQGGQAQVGDQCRGQRNDRNQNGDAINDNIRGDVRKVIKNNDHKGCTYKEFLACNTKEYDGKGGVVVYTRWIEKMELADHAAYIDRFHELARLVPHLVTLENRRIERYVYGLAPHIRGMVAAMEPSTINKAVQIVGTLTDEAVGL
ncbi:hypothetical protein Tco_0805757, partial [Tanacetum coccineum]